jgi:hypothetical protein
MLAAKAESASKKKGFGLKRHLISRRHETSPAKDTSETQKSPTLLGRTRMVKIVSASSEKLQARETSDKVDKADSNVMKSVELEKLDHIKAI